MESDSKLVQAVLRLDVRNDVCKAIILLNLCELRFQPLDLEFWISSIGLVDQPPVHVIASLHVQADNFSFWVEWEWLREESVLTEGIAFIVRQQVLASPCWSNMVDGIVCVWTAEILDIDWPGIMIAKGWVNGNVRIWTE
jgi:hypothetical protein